MKKNIVKCLFWILEGILVGVGAMLPGLSGGALCVAFGAYLPIIEFLSHPIKKLREHFKLLLFFGIGGVTGFVGIAKIISSLFGEDNPVALCVFVGLILGTIPEIWKDAGEKGRPKSSYAFTAFGFVAILALLIFLNSFGADGAFTLSESFRNYVLCGALWGLSFIIPGLSSSTLIIFIGLYQPMSDGIGKLDMGVVIPLAIGMAACVLLLSKLINKAYEKFYSRISHTILGVVIATAVMIIPFGYFRGINILYGLVCIILGSIASYTLTVICDKLKN